ncbi:MAG: class I SAM-dependent methyltransferase [Leptospiraceae bacterium]|nr:class I SAM-dependent methyltransferase [Leptospiraceae bacterium]
MDSFPDCPVCQTPMQFLYRIERFVPALEILVCPACGLQRQARYPVELAGLYTADYYTGKAEYSYRDERSQLAYDRYVWRARLKQIARFQKPPSAFLDVGCSFGGFVASAREWGYQSAGLDISPYAVQYARSQGLDVRQGEVTAGIWPDSQFDIITLIEVIEHLPDPRAALSALARIAKPGALLVLQTANFNGRQARRAGSSYHYYLPGHFVYYSSSNLRRLLEQFDFQVIKIFYPVDFGLGAKLLKSRSRFKSWSDYLQWLRIAWYHLSGKIHWRDRAWQSSMVLYARYQPRTTSANGQ